MLIDLVPSSATGSIQWWFVFDLLSIFVLSIDVCILGMLILTLESNSTWVHTYVPFHKFYSPFGIRELSYFLRPSSILKLIFIPEDTYRRPVLETLSIIPIGDYSYVLFPRHSLRVTLSEWKKAHAGMDVTQSWVERIRKCCNFRTVSGLAFASSHLWWYISQPEVKTPNISACITSCHLS